MHVREIVATDIAVVDRHENLLMVEERMAARHLRHLQVVERRAFALTLVVRVRVQRRHALGSLTLTLSWRGERRTVGVQRS